MKEEVKRDWYDNGQLALETSYLNERIHGLKKWWYSNGKLLNEIPYKNNIQCGAKIWFKY
jgi:antitoxin component YwqK of YwqJK toxin-antitoxin module